MVSDFERIFAALDGVRFVVVGGVAVVLHGHPRVTADLDLVVSVDVRNVEQLVRGLADLGFQPAVPVDAHDLADPAKRLEWRTVHHALVLSFTSPTLPATSVDVFIEPPLDFDELWSKARVVPIGRETVRIASIEHLVEMKTGTGRQRDVEDVEALRRLEPT